MAKPLLVVDTPSMLFRAFYALPKSIVGPDGNPVNALLGTANLILREVEAHDPRAVVLCFGPDAASYRTELYPAYHAERPEVPDQLSPQWADCRAFFEAFGWAVVASEDLEADDLLGTYAEREAEAGGRALILTGDRDMYQCATDAVTVLYVRTGGKGAEEVTPDGVRERYGVDPGPGPRLHRPARRPLRRAARRQGRRREDRGRAAAQARRPRDPARQRDPRAAAETARGADRPARGAARLQGHRDPARRRRRAAARPPDRLGGRGESGARTRDAQTRRAPDRSRQRLIHRSQSSHR